jgi:antitoxin (DNA-binding transcriptional repressor) of toxin-antitoxin stability system
MKTATVRDLRNHFSRVSGWIENGEAVEITKGGKAFARLVPAAEGKARKLVKVDFARQLRKTWGNRVFSAAEVAAMRAAELEGEQG